VQDHFAKEPLSYLSVGVPDSKWHPASSSSRSGMPNNPFSVPNYFTVTGPYGPLGHGSFLPIIELLIRNFLTCIKKIQAQNIKSLTPRREVAEAFAEHAQLFLKRTAWTSGCSSWFKQGKVDGPLAMFPGTRLVYMDLLKEPRYEDYRIEYQSGNPFGFLGNGFSTREYDGRDLSYYLGTKQNPGAMMPESPMVARKVTNGVVGT
jgi:hypothetical protein